MNIIDIIMTTLHRHQPESPHPFRQGKDWKKYCGLLFLATAALAATSCQDDYAEATGIGANRRTISLAGDIEQVAATRVNDNGFADGDVMGVYVVDYQGTTPGTLQTTGNRADNVRHTFDEAGYRWESAYDIYWKDDHTPIDVYGYYPFGEPSDVNAYAFSVQLDQNKAAEGGSLGGYEASDLLWGKVGNVAPTERVIRLPMRHRMSSPRVMLEEGEGFAEGEWAALEKAVLVLNTRTEATVNLADGSVTPVGEVSAKGIIPLAHDGQWRAIVVPQTVAAGTPLFSLTVGTVAYTFKKDEALTYVSGKMHNFTIRVNKKTPSGDYEFVLAGESITAWENDPVSHDATAKEYIIINSTPGHLKDSITAANKDYRELRNLKITGEIDINDFYFMRDSMDMLQALNMKEVIIKAGYNSYANIEGKELAIPASAFDHKYTLTRVVLPDKLNRIENSGFADCRYLTGSLNIPEGVTYIGSNAFNECRSLTGSLSLPSTLVKIEGGDYSGNMGAFQNCGFVCELKLPAGLEYIGPRCFSGCGGLYGELHLPSVLTYIGEEAFGFCKNLTGSLSIPQGVSEIHGSSFAECGFNGTLTLHDGIIAIGDQAFRSTPFKGELVLPKNITAIGADVFNGCDFSGELKLPDHIMTIRDNAFANNWRMMGILEFPEGIQSIGQGAFNGCRSIEGLVFPPSMESIQNQAFYMCTGIGSIVCKGDIPPYMQSSAFEGVPKDNFTLEVPESAVQQYQAAAGWSDFKRIAAHRELVCRPNLATALQTECTRDLVIDAEGDWEVESMPDWCTLSATSGSKKTELKLTIQEMGGGSGSRTGEIVFKLKDQDYRHTCTVSQYGYQYGEDEVITLQKATRGNTGGINLVFLGDGFDAKDISEGKYMEAMQEQVENFFGIEPYTTYHDYFNVYTAIAVSPESGIGTVNTIRYAKFETTYTGGVGLKCDYEATFQYALDMKTTVTRDNLNQSLIIMVPNSTDYGGICQMWDDGSAIAFCPMSTYGYPLDTRGVIQHEAGGHGFGKLGDEYIYHNEFIDFCTCTCCGHVLEFEYAKGLGWYDNLSLTGKMHEVPWSHLIFDEKYSDFVDIFEGGFMHNRGVFRSEQNSCMNNDIPYYSTISRESIVKRIKAYAGEEYSFEEFKANDKVEAGAVTRAVEQAAGTRSVHGFQYPPQIHRGSPL